MGEISEYSVETLLKTNNALEKELENTKQTLYDTQRQQRRLEALELEYQEEINNYQNIEKKTEDKYKDEIKKLNEILIDTRSKYREALNSVDCLTKILTEKDEKIKCLNDKLEAENSLILIGENNTFSNEELSEELRVMKELNEELKKINDETVKTFQKKVQAYEETIKGIQREREELKETLNSKNIELKEFNSLVEELQDQIFCLNQEITVFKKPQDVQSQGNSLFAEVDDKRLELQQAMKKIKSQYIEMKGKQDNLQKQITMLIVENSSLLAKLENEEDARNRYVDDVIESQNQQIQILTEERDRYKTQLKEMYELNKKHGSNEFYQNMLQARYKDIEKLENMLGPMYVAEITMKHDLGALKNKNEILTHKILQLKIEIEGLKATIEEMKLDKEAKRDDERKENEAKLEEYKKEERRNTIWGKLDPRDDQENVDTTNIDIEEVTVKQSLKKVQFAGDIAEKPSRRCTRKIICCKPIHFTSTTNQNTNPQD